MDSLQPFKGVVAILDFATAKVTHNQSLGLPAQEPETEPTTHNIAKMKGLALRLFDGADTMRWPTWKQSR